MRDQLQRTFSHPHSPRAALRDARCDQRLTCRRGCAHCVCVCLCADRRPIRVMGNECLHARQRAARTAHSRSALACTLSPVPRLAVVGAEGLYKRDLFQLPDPFAVVTVDGEQTNTTETIKKTLSPYWGEEFEVCVPLPFCARSA